MLHTSTSGPYGLCPRISGAAYAGDPHWVLRFSLVDCPSGEETKRVLLSPKSRADKCEKKKSVNKQQLAKIPRILSKLWTNGETWLSITVHRECPCPDTPVYMITAKSSMTLRPRPHSTTPDNFKNTTVTGQFGFLFDKNSGKEITCLK